MSELRYGIPVCAFCGFCATALGLPAIILVSVVQRLGVSSVAIVMAAITPKKIDANNQRRRDNVPTNECHIRTGSTSTAAVLRYCDPTGTASGAAVPGSRGVSYIGILS